MRMKNTYIPTLRDVPKETETKGYELLVRSGMLKKTSGVYTMLPLGASALYSLKNNILNNSYFKDLQEISFLDSENKVSDSAMLLDTIKGEIRSYKKLPQKFFTEGLFRNRKEPANGLERSENYHGIEITVLDKDEESMNNSIESLKTAFMEITEKSGLKAIECRADNEFHFVVEDEMGQTEIRKSERNDKAWLKEYTPVNIEYDEKDIEEGEMRLVNTPHCISIDDVSEFLKVKADHCAKAVDIIADEKPVLVIIPGDRELSYEKLAAYLKCEISAIRMMNDDEIKEKFNSYPGFTGPSGDKKGVRVILDERITGMKNLVIGADLNDSHYINSNYGRDFNGETAEDLLTVEEKDSEKESGKPYVSSYGIDIAEIDIKGIEESRKCQAVFSDENGKEKIFHTVTLRINLSAYLQAVIQKQNDEKGIVWNKNIAPFDVMITVVNIKSEEQRNLAEELYQKIRDKGLKVLLDDRDERAGVKFNDRDLLGIPLRITVGKGASERYVEYSGRSDMENQNISSDEVLNML